MVTAIETRGFRIFPGYLNHARQKDLTEVLRHVAARAPLFSPAVSSGKTMSVRMTSAGRLGWYSDQDGYRYRGRHPSGAAWPPIPEAVAGIWRDLCPDSPAPDCCLVNFYSADARMGLHQDRDEADFQHPVLSVSLGDDALFRMGGASRSDPTTSHWLKSGDVVLLTGSSRLAFHGVDRIRFGSSRLLPKGGRINLTLRVVD